MLQDPGFTVRLDPDPVNSIRSKSNSWCFLRVVSRSGVFLRPYLDPVRIQIFLRRIRIRVNFNRIRSLALSNRKDQIVLGLTLTFTKYYYPHLIPFFNLIFLFWKWSLLDVEIIYCTWLDCETVNSYNDYRFVGYYKIGLNEIASNHIYMCIKNSG